MRALQMHDAIMSEEREDVPDGTVLKEFRRGFRLGAQLLRPAMVQVRAPCGAWGFVRFSWAAGLQE